MQAGTKILVLVTAAVAGATLFLSLRPKVAPFESAIPFTDTTNIIFKERGYGQPDKLLTVTNPNEIAHMISLIQLETKGPCNCPLHLHEAIFQKRSGPVQISFCEHCFDVVNGKAVWGYRMPARFYEEFLAHVQKQTNTPWEVRMP